MSNSPFSDIVGSLKNWLPAFRSPRAIGFFLLAIGFAVLLFLIGLKAWGQPFFGTFETEFLDFEVAQQIDLPSISARDITVTFRGTVDGPVAYSSDEDPIVLELAGQPLGPFEKGTEPDTPFELNTAMSILIPEGALVTLRASRFSEHMDLVISQAPELLELVTTSDSSITVKSSFCEIEECPEAVRVTENSKISVTPLADEEIVLRFSGQTGQQNLAKFAPITEIITWEHVETVMGLIRSSGIGDGSIQFANSAGSSRSFYSGEVVDLTATDLIMRDLQVEDGVITVQLSGELDAASTSIGSERVSIMPSWFDVLANDARVRYALGFLSLLIGLGQLIGWSRLVPEKSEN